MTTFVVELECAPCACGSIPLLTHVHYDPNLGSAGVAMSCPECDTFGPTRKQEHWIAALVLWNRGERGPGLEEEDE